MKATLVRPATAADLTDLAALSAWSAHTATLPAPAGETRLVAQAAGRAD